MFLAILKVISFHILFFNFKTFVLVKPPFPFIAPPPSLYPHAWANLETMCTKTMLIMYQKTTTTTATMLKDTHSFVSTRSSVTLLPK